LIFIETKGNGNVMMTFSSERDKSRRAPNMRDARRSTRRMIKFFMIPALCLILSGAEAAGGDVSDCRDSTKTPNTERVIIAGNCLIMPVGRILLVRKKSQYCAVRLTEAWQGETVLDRFANYESYYQGDGSGDLSKADVQFTADQLIARRSVPKFPQFPRFLSHPAGPENKQIRCGPIKLAWFGLGIYFNEHLWTTGDRGMELAPTKWTDISQVNVFDPRLKWYKYDGKRENVSVPIEHLLEGGGRQK
jgi:hypothetical protein